MKVCIQRTTFKVIEDQVITLASPFVPQQLVQTTPPPCLIMSYPTKSISRKRNAGYSCTREK